MINKLHNKKENFCATPGGRIKYSIIGVVQQQFLSTFYF